MLVPQSLMVLVGNLAGDPELRFTENGTAIAKFNVIVNFRRKQGDEWVDGEPMSIWCTAWRQLAENVAETLTKGTRVIVYGSLKPNNYEKDGEKKYGFQMDLETCGPDLTFAQAVVTKNPSKGGGGGRSGEWPDGAKPAAKSGGQAKKATGGKAGGFAQGGSDFDEEPPF